MHWHDVLSILGMLLALQCHRMVYSATVSSCCRACFAFAFAAQEEACQANMHAKPSTGTHQQAEGMTVFRHFVSLCTRIVLSHSVAMALHSTWLVKRALIY